MLGFVPEGIRQLQKAGLVGDGDPWLIASATWATLHGLVMLTLDGQTKGVVADVDALVDEATRIMMFGMAPRRDWQGESHGLGTIDSPVFVSSAATSDGKIRSHGNVVALGARGIAGDPGTTMLNTTRAGSLIA